MKKIIFFFIAILTVSFSQDEKISIDDLVNIKWKMKRYITDGINLRIERSRRKDYQIFKPNNKITKVIKSKKEEF